MKRYTLAAIMMVGVLTTGAYALGGNNQQNDHRDTIQGEKNTGRTQMHTTNMNHAGSDTKTVLTEAGNDAFGTIQEVIKKLEETPDTDWSKVNIEALRVHLLDMQDMTLNIEVLSQKNITNGAEATVKATTPRAYKALKRVFMAHPSQLKSETGWDMNIKEREKNFIITTTTSNKSEINKIRGLGYIGLMAYGPHHQQHHWMMANGQEPHM